MINVVLIIVSVILCVLFFGFVFTKNSKAKRIGIAALVSVILLTCSYIYTNQMTKNLPVKVVQGNIINVQNIIFKNENDCKNRIHPIAIIDENGHKKIITNSSLTKVVFVKSSSNAEPGTTSIMTEYISVTANEFHSLFVLTKKIPSTIYVYNCDNQNAFCLVE